MAREWTLEGDYVEACNCDVACQCIWMEAPDDDACTASLAWHVRDGHYGDVNLDGLSVALLVTTEDGVMFAPETGWDIVLLVDEAADDEQRAALQDIYLGRAGGIFAPVADVHVESAEVATAPIEFSREGTDFSVEVGEVLSIDADEAIGFNEEVGTISPHPLTADNEMQTGRTSTATVGYDEDFSWDVSGNNAYLGDFQLANG